MTKESVGVDAREGDGKCDIALKEITSADERQRFEAVSGELSANVVITTGDGGGAGVHELDRILRGAKRRQRAKFAFKKAGEVSDRKKIYCHHKDYDLGTDNFYCL